MNQSINLYAEATRLAMKSNQVEPAGSEYFITLQQLESLLLREAEPVSVKPDIEDRREIVREHPHFARFTEIVNRYFKPGIPNSGYAVYCLYDYAESLSAQTEHGCRECRDLHNTICGCNCHAGESASPRMPEGKTE